MATRPTCGLNAYITPVVSGVPNAEHVDKIYKWLPSPNADKVDIWGKKPGNGYLAYVWAKWTHHPCRIEVPNAQQRDNNQKWLPGPHMG